MTNTIMHITRKDLKDLSTRDFNEKTILIVDNKYRILVDGLHTTAEKEDNPMIALKESQMPSYIKNFVF
ncbi:hypothetical protein LCGC14_1482850 [marine sediment metagenome]|uniref:Uncharacterized protein n=1 Tax=marine sediment metagenome TaxID=412755 RepID=A0A0F9LPI1_9ZZZZ